MKRVYEEPVLEMIRWDRKDIIETSGEPTPGDNELPIVPIGGSTKDGYKD